jgi:hypothetical protein
MKEKMMCAIFSGEADSEEKAEKVAKSYRNCPYVSLMATKGTQLFATFFLPERQRWWIEYVEKKPRETFGLEKATVTFADSIYHPKPTKMRLPKKKTEISPCESDCRKCAAYERCSGCPATIFYKQEE